MRPLGARIAQHHMHRLSAAAGCQCPAVMRAVAHAGGRLVLPPPWLCLFAGHRAHWCALRGGAPFFSPQSVLPLARSSVFAFRRYRWGGRPIRNVPRTLCLRLTGPSPSLPSVAFLLPPPGWRFPLTHHRYQPGFTVSSFLVCWTSRPVRLIPGPVAHTLEPGFACPRHEAL